MRCVVFTLLLFTFSCQKAYFGTMEAFGYHKRDLLVTRVQDARDSQQAAKQQFQDALDVFSKAVGFDGGELESAYKQMKRELERSESSAQTVRDRIDEVESVAEALFKEWRKELDQYHSQDLRRQSERQLDATERQYQGLIAAMQRAESKIDPVLNPLRDQVLFLKHNLNARAIASLEGELGSVERDVRLLLNDMESAIKEADAFIAHLGVD